MKSFTHTNSVEDALMQMHDMAMGNDEQMACVGRAGKHLANMVETWIGDETPGAEAAMKAWNARAPAPPHDSKQG